MASTMQDPSGGSSTAGGGWSGSAGGIVGGILGAGAAIYDSYQSNKTARQNTDKTIAANKAEAELAYQRQLEMWNRQNLYNSPEAQMARFKAAGLNPHLIYQQGNAGNSANIPNYQPPKVAYQYEAPRYGAAINSILPTLMSVGTWMQHMRQSEVEIKQKQTNTERAQQMVEYLTQMNPKLLQQAENRLSLFPYQKDMQDYLSNQARTKLFEMEQSFRHQYGDDLFNDMGSSWERKRLPSIGGMKGLDLGIRKLKFVEQEAQSRLKQAQASWTDFDITNPQALMQMVLQGVMGMAGQTLRLSTHRPLKSRTRTRGFTSDRSGTFDRETFEY